MTIIFNAAGERRKELVKAVSKFSGVKAQYLRVPTLAYNIGCYTIDKAGNLSFDEEADGEKVKTLLEYLSQNGFVAETPATPEMSETEKSEQEESIGFTVQIPIEKVSVENLMNLLEARGSLIRKALAVEDLPVITDEEKISFPWFSEGLDAETVKAYSHFIAALCEMSKNQKRISAKEKPVENEKYAFRCFLLRLGFIGNEYKTERKILLQNLSGSSAFKGGVKNDISE